MPPARHRTAVALIMLIIAVVGIKITARAQVAMALVEYLILIGLSIARLVAVLAHHAGTYSISKGRFSLSGVGGHGGAAAGGDPGGLLPRSARRPSSAGPSSSR